MDKGSQNGILSTESKVLILQKSDQTILSWSTQIRSESRSYSANSSCLSPLYCWLGQSQIHTDHSSLRTDLEDRKSNSYILMVFPFEHCDLVNPPNLKTIPPLKIWTEVIFRSVNIAIVAVLLPTSPNCSLVLSTADQLVLDL